MASRRGQSEVVGTILLTGVVVVVVGVTTATVVLDTDEVSQEAPLVELDVDVTAQDVRLTHEGGDAVANEDVVVVLRTGSRGERHRLGDDNVTGDDGSFDPGETFSEEHDVGAKTADLLVVHEPSGTLLLDRPVDVGVPGEGLPPGARFDVSPAHPDPGETVTFDASASDDNDGVVQRYEWTFGDGNTTMSTVPSVNHTYSTEDYYDVTLTVIDDEGLEDETTATVRVTPLRAPESPADVTNGLEYEYSEAAGDYTSLPDFDAESPERTGVTDDFNISKRDRNEDFAFRFSGYVEVPEDGEYTFYTTSDDGSELYVGDALVVDNGGQHAAREASGTIQLQEGKHAITVTHFEHHGGEVLDVEWEGPSVSKGTIPESRLYREDRPVARFDTACTGLTCEFDASSSVVPGSVDTYRWDFGDGNTTTSTGPAVSHSYGSTGDFTVNLTVTTDGGETDSRERTVALESLREPENPAEVVGDVRYEYHEADGEYTSLPDFENATAEREGTTGQFDLSPSHREDDFGFRFTGYIEVPDNDTYTFYTTSDDGSRLSVGDAVVVDNGGLHAPSEASGEIGLRKGKHAITVTQFEHHGGETLAVEWESGNVSKSVVPASRLYRENEPLARFGADCAGLACEFDASNSSASGSIDTYSWAFGDGNTTTTTDPTVNYTYEAAGDYAVNLTVATDAGQTDSRDRTVSVEPSRAPEDPADVSQGMEYEYYEASDEYTGLPAFDAETPKSTGVADGFNISKRDRNEDFAFRFTGYVEVPEDGKYTFYTTSDDGSELAIGETLVVDNGGQHAPREESATIALEAGTHAITVTHFEHHGGEELDVAWEGPSGSKEAIPGSRLYREHKPLASFAQTCTGLDCEFDASASTNTGGSATEYTWDFGDGTRATTTGATVNHTYASAGTYEVRLNVTGDGGGHDVVARDVGAG